jgi:AcrR family transcriptional regulator
MNEKALQIIEIAGPLFSKKGIRAVSMNEIAQSCGISKKKLYSCFTNKNDILSIAIFLNYKKVRKQLLPLKIGTGIRANDLSSLFKIVKTQSRILSPIFLNDLEKQHHHLNLMVTMYFELLPGLFIDRACGLDWYQRQLLQIFKDFKLPENERQDLLDQLNFNYQRWATSGLIRFNT